MQSCKVQPLVPLAPEACSRAASVVTSCSFVTQVAQSGNLGYPAWGRDGIWCDRSMDFSRGLRPAGVGSSWSGH